MVVTVHVCLIELPCIGCHKELIVEPAFRVHSHLTTTMCFSCRHVRTVSLVTMQPISGDMLTTSKICVAVAKCERALSMCKTSGWDKCL